MDRKQWNSIVAGRHCYWKMASRSMVMLVGISIFIYAVMTHNSHLAVVGGWVTAIGACIAIVKISEV